MKVSKKLYLTVIMNIRATMMPGEADPLLVTKDESLVAPSTFLVLTAGREQLKSMPLGCQAGGGSTCRPQFSFPA